MQVTSTTQTQYTTTSNTANNTKIKEGDIDPNKGQNYTLKTLDKEGNELLNQVLEGKTDEEKWKIKLVIDLNLSMEIKNGELTPFTDIDNSKSNAISKLEAYVKMQRELDNPDMMGVIAASEKFLEAYKKNDSTKDVKNQENSVVDKFLEDLYSKESITFQSNITKENIKNNMDEFHKTLVDTLGDSDEAKTEISKKMDEYKKELLNQYEESLKNSDSKSLSLEQQAIIKVLSDENFKETSSLKELLANQKEK